MMKQYNTIKDYKKDMGKRFVEGMQIERIFAQNFCVNYHHYAFQDDIDAIDVDTEGLITYDNYIQSTNPYRYPIKLEIKGYAIYKDGMVNIKLTDGNGKEKDFYNLDKVDYIVFCQKFRDKTKNRKYIKNIFILDSKKFQQRLRDGWREGYVEIEDNIDGFELKKALKFKLFDVDNGKITINNKFKDLVETIFYNVNLDIKIDKDIEDYFINKFN